MEILALLRHGDASHLEPIIAVRTTAKLEGLDRLLHLISQLGLGGIVLLDRVGDAGFGLLDRAVRRIGAGDGRRIQRIER